jgi:ABC-type nickel/cobalt efflux system permease component RcnA
MTGFWAAYVTAFTLGAVHALEVDHMVAVTAFVGGNPRLGAAVSFGVRWGIGHAAAVLVAGALLAWSRITVPFPVQRWAEIAVGVALIGVGLWAFRNARRLHLHGPEQHGGHAHLHTHSAGSQPHEHTHAAAAIHVHAYSHPHTHDPNAGSANLSTVVGAVHGLSGTAPVVALIPVTLMPSVGAAVGYLVAFGIGTTMGMGAYAALAALAVSRARTSIRLARVVAFGTATASLVVGFWWLLSSAWPTA